MRRRAASPALLSLLLLALAPPAIAGASVASPEARLQVELARVLRQVGNESAAESALARALEIDPACAAAWLERGFLAEENGSFSRARRAFTRAFELAPALGDPLRNPELVASRAALAAQAALRRHSARQAGEWVTGTRWAERGALVGARPAGACASSERRR